MRNCLYLFFFIPHFTTGCVLSHEQQTEVITGYTGGSVVLPCSCAQPQSTLTTLTWQFQHGNKWIEVLNDEKFRGRRVLFNENSPTNLSLLISDLRQKDEGYYKCVTEPDSTAFVQLTVKGCDLVRSEHTIEVTVYSGESVLLPCFCTELLAKPEFIQWKYYIENNYKEIYPTEELERLKNRVKLLNQTTPGNLSLHISDLSTNDQGIYYCHVPSQPLIPFRLFVEEKPQVHTTIPSTDRPSYRTQDPTTTQQTHNTPQYVFIVMGLFLSLLLLTLLATISWRCRVSRKKKKVTSDGEDPKKDIDNQKDRDKEDDVLYSAVVHVKTSSTAAPKETDPEEFTEYARINIKR